MEPAEALVRAHAADPDWSGQAGPFLSCLTAIARSRRDPTLAETAGLDYQQAAEILLLIERLPPAASELGSRGLARRLFRRLFGRLF